MTYYIEPGLLINERGGASAWFHLDLDRQELLGEQEWHKQRRRHVSRLAALAGYSCQLLGVHRPWSVEGWIERFTDSTRLVCEMPNDGWRQGVGEVADRIAGISAHRKEVFLGIYLDQRGEAGWRALLRAPERLLSMEDPRPPSKLLEGLRAQAQMLRPKLSVGGLGGRPASSAQLRWLLRRTYWRGMSVPPGEPNRPCWGGEAKELLAGAKIDNHRDHLHVVRPFEEVEFFCTSLGYGHIPGKLPDMEAYWLALQDEQPFPTDWEMRFRVMEGAEATHTVEAQIRPLRDQYRHLTEPGAGEEVPPALEEKLAAAEGVVYEITHHHQSAVTAWPRLMVVGSTLPELRERVNTLRAYFKDEMKVGLSVPTGDQLTLFREFMPGTQFDLRHSYGHPMALEALAGSGIFGGSRLGDDQGPYIGVTTLGGEPVCFDPHLAARRNGATLIAIAGMPGSGKSNAAMNMVLWARRRTASVVMVGPAGVPSGFADLCRQCGTVNEVDLSDPRGSSMSLDPYLILPAGLAKPLAVTMLRTMLPPMSGSVRTAIVGACSRAAEGPHPRLIDAVSLLCEHPTPEVRDAGIALRDMSTWAHAEACFAREQAAPLNLYDALTVLSFRGLPLPNAVIDPDHWTDQQRVAVAIMHAMVALAGQVMWVGGAEHETMTVYDDAVPILVTENGRAQIERESLEGRKANHVPVVITHNATHFLSGGTRGTGEQTLVSNLAAAFIFRLGDDKEAEEGGCRLLHIPPTEANLRVLTTQGPDVDLEAIAAAEATGEAVELPEYSECVMRCGRDVGRVQLDLVTRENREAMNTTAGRRRQLAS